LWGNRRRSGDDGRENVREIQKRVLDLELPVADRLRPPRVDAGLELGIVQQVT